MRRAAKVDRNQSEIVQVFRKLGFSVVLLHRAGDGVPDTILGRSRVNTLVEIKDGKKRPSERKLTPKQEVFFRTWKGDARVIESVDDALKLAKELP